MSTQVRALDLDDDWNFGKGRSDYYRDDDAIAQSIATRLRSFLGDCFFDLSAGVDWFTLLGSKNVTGLVLSIKATILGTYGVVKLTDLSTVPDPSTRNLAVSYSVETIFGGSVTRGLSLGLLLTESGLVITDEDGNRIVG